VKGDFIMSNFYSRDCLAARLRETGGAFRFVISYQKYRRLIDVGSRCHLEVPPVQYERAVRVHAVMKELE
jgi:hypothetical protein